MDNMTLGHFLYVVLGALIVPGFYYLVRCLRALVAWMQNVEAPRERIIPHLVLFAVTGGALGGIVYEPFQAALFCSQANEGLIHCLMGR